MNDIQKERVEILQKVINNIEDKNKTNFADKDELKELLKKKDILDKKCRPIWQETIDNEKDSHKKYKLQLDKAEVEKKLIIRSGIEKQIKEREIEILFFGGIQDLHELYEEFYESQKQIEIEKIEHCVERLEEAKDTFLIECIIEESAEIIPLRKNDYINIGINGYTEDEILSFKKFRLEYLKSHLNSLKEEDV